MNPRLLLALSIGLFVLQRTRAASAAAAVAPTASEPGVGEAVADVIPGWDFANSWGDDAAWMGAVDFLAGVSVAGLQPEITTAIPLLADIVFGRTGTRMVITSGTEGQHVSGSLHYRGLAVDIRDKYFAVATRAALVADFKAALGPLYQVLNETDPPHIHVAYRG